MANTVKLRIDPKTRTADMEGLQFFVLGDTVQLYLSEATGATAASLEAYLWPKSLPIDPTKPLAYKSGFTAVLKTPGDFVASFVVESDELQTLLATTPPGSEVTVRLRVRDTTADFTYLDMDVPVRPDPVYGNTVMAPTLNPYVTQSQLANLVPGETTDLLVAKADILALTTTAAAMPLDTLNDTNAMLQFLIAGLATLSAP